MMPGVGFEEMILLVIVAIVVIGPKDLPLMMRKFGRFTGKMRAMAFEFKQGIDELGRQAELDELRKEVADLKKRTGLDDIRREFEDDKARPRERRDAHRRCRRRAAAIGRSPPPGAPAAAGAAEARSLRPMPALSADHPGYDAGEDFRIAGAVPPRRSTPIACGRRAAANAACRRRPRHLRDDEVTTAGDPPHRTADETCAKQDTSA